VQSKSLGEEAVLHWFSILAIPPISRVAKSPAGNCGFLLPAPLPGERTYRFRTFERPALSVKSAKLPQSHQDKPPKSQNWLMSDSAVIVPESDFK
jgi:hypothetical protein